MTKDTGVAIHSDALHGKRVLLAIAGGIAAVESVKLARELRRHQADLTVITVSYTHLTLPTKA